MKKAFPLYVFILALTIFLPLSLTAQVKDSISSSDKLDSVYRLQQKIYGEQKNNPLFDKKIGVEFNIPRVLFISDALTLSGGFSLFNAKNKTEISFPFYFQRPKDDDDLTSFTLDCHYRYFLRNTLNGFYLSGFARYAYLSGTLGSNDFIIFEEEPVVDKKGTENKLGVGIGIGYRIFSYKGLYWGTSISFGRYLIGKSNKFRGGFLSIDDDNEYIFDFEFFKFGWAF